MGTKKRSRRAVARKASTSHGGAKWIGRGDRSGVLAGPKSRHSVNQEPIEDAVVCPAYGVHAATCPATGSMSGTGSEYRA
jgi:hypothetical protein